MCEASRANRRNDRERSGFGFQRYSRTPDTSVTRRSVRNEPDEHARHAGAGKTLLSSHLLDSWEFGMRTGGAQNIGRVRAACVPCRAASPRIAVPREASTSPSLLRMRVPSRRQVRASPCGGQCVRDLPACAASRGPAEPTTPRTGLPSAEGGTPRALIALPMEIRWRTHHEVPSSLAVAPRLPGAPKTYLFIRRATSEPGSCARREWQAARPREAP